jgi:phosphoglycerate kinase
MILDVGPLSVADHRAQAGSTVKTLVWNGPLGAFETAALRHRDRHRRQGGAKRVKAGKLVAVAGGGDTVAAMNHAGVADDLTYVSTAGGAFLEWMEGKALPLPGRRHLPTALAAAGVYAMFSS